MTAVTAGLGLKPQHFEDAERCAAPGVWFEVHAENYTVDGGPRLAWLERIRARHPVSLHGVALSLAADATPDRRHLERLAALVDRIEPLLVSEHLRGARGSGAYRPDLLPVPRSSAVRQRVVTTSSACRIGCGVESRSKTRRITSRSKPTPATKSSSWRDRAPQRLRAAARRQQRPRQREQPGFPRGRVIDAIPADLVAEIHLAGHGEDPMLGAALLIDTHDAPSLRSFGRCTSAWSRDRAAAHPDRARRAHPAVRGTAARTHRAHARLVEPIAEAA